MQGTSPNLQSTAAPRANTAAPAVTTPTGGAATGTTTTGATSSATDPTLTGDQQYDQNLYDQYNNALLGYNAAVANEQSSGADDYANAQKLAGVQQGNINQDLNTGTTNATQDFNNTNAQRDTDYSRDLSDLDRQNTQNQGNIQASYAARGLGSSSAVETAQANRATDYGTATSRAGQDYNTAVQVSNQLFNRNISSLNTNAQRQLTDINNYLNNLQTQYNNQAQAIDTNKFYTDAGYRLQAQGVLNNLSQINQSILDYHNSVVSSTNPLNAAPTQATVGAQQEGLSDYIDPYNSSVAADPYINMGQPSSSSPYAGLSGSYISGSATDPTKLLTGQ